jgi:hypothetical protein
MANQSAKKILKQNEQMLRNALAMTVGFFVCFQISPFLPKQIFRFVYFLYLDAFRCFFLVSSFLHFFFRFLRKCQKNFGPVLPTSSISLPPREILFMFFTNSFALSFAILEMLAASQFDRCVDLQRRCLIFCPQSFFLSP